MHGENVTAKTVFWNVVGVSGMILLFGYVAIWISVGSIVHRRLVRQEDWDDWGRLLLWFTAFIGFPLLTIGLPWAAVLVMT